MLKVFSKSFTISGAGAAEDGDSVVLPFRRQRRDGAAPDEAAGDGVVLEFVRRAGVVDGAGGDESPGTAMEG